MGKPEICEDPRFKTHAARLQEENAVVLLDVIRSWSAGKSSAEIDKLAGEYGFAAHKVCDGKDHFEDEHLIKRNFTCTVDDSVYGEIVEEGIVPKFSETPGRIKWAGRPVGFDNEYVLKRFLGLSTEQIQYLKDHNIIGKWVDNPPGRKPPASWDGKSGIKLG
jgi:crotonobetainyl-CoA:carnitine CoA-transferase CaiB-like acyl-CoA transferase